MNLIESLVYKVANREGKIVILRQEIRRIEALKKFHTRLADGAEQDIQNLENELGKLQRQ